MATPSRDPPQGSARGGWWIPRSIGKFSFDVGISVGLLLFKKRKEQEKGLGRESWQKGTGVGIPQDSRRKRTEATKTFLRGQYTQP